MRRLPSPRLFDVWERGCAESPARRALALLRAARPDASFEELAAMTVGERDAELLRLRGAIFGDELTAVTECPACRERLESAVSVADLLGAGGSVREPASPAPIVTGDVVVDFRAPTLGDLIALEEAWTSEPGAASDVTAARGDLLRRCLRSASRSGAEIPIEELDHNVLAALDAGMSAADPLADTRLDLACPACGHRWLAPFDIASFLWAELEAWVDRTAWEVHALASAYGWSETEILAMGGARRQLYLDRLPS